MTTPYETACQIHEHEMVVSAGYSPDFKREAVRLAKGKQGTAATANALGVTEQTLHCWMESHPEGLLMRSGTKKLGPEQVEIGRLKDELTMDKMERDALEKTIRYFDSARR